MLMYLLITGASYCGLGCWLGLRWTRAPVHADHHEEYEPLSEATAEKVALEADQPDTAEAVTVEPVVQATTEAEPVPEQSPSESELSEEFADSTEPQTIRVDATTTTTPELPAAWLDVLEECTTCQSFVEASAQVLRLEVGKYRDSLVEIEAHTRVVQRNLQELHSEEGNTSEHQTELQQVQPRLQLLCQDLRERNSRWLQRQNEALSVLSEKRASCQEFSDLVDQMEHLLLGQVAQIETTESNLQRQQQTSTPSEFAQQIVHEIQKLVALAHDLRDIMLQSLVAIMRREDRLQDWSPVELTDPATKLPNRAGLEHWLQQYQSDSRNLNRTLSFALIDLDAYSKLNHQWGIRLGDQVLAAMGPMLHNILRKNRGFDMTARFAGQQFALLLTDTGPRGANSALERIRQTIENSYFDHPQGRIQVTLSAGVTEVRSHDSIETLVDRMQRGLALAKQSGRNQISLDEGSGPVLLLPPKLDILPRIAELVSDA